jgi:tRNA A37 N6-isopentenylltransferase MiaA
MTISNTMTISINTIITVIGPTAVGKTSLGIELGKAFHTEVISIDSLQCYKAGGIVTAKPTLAETKGVPHHLIDYLEADEEPHSFIEDALACIAKVQRSGKVPILVGGSTSLTIPLLEATRSQGNRIFAIILGSPPSIHKHNIEARVDEMVRCGLVHEMMELYELERSYLGDRPNFLKGVWKTIGYKEFYPYLKGGKKGSAKALEKAIEDTKINSVFYAKLQWDWIQKEVCPALEDMSIPFIDMQATSKEDLRMVGTTCVRAYLCFLHHIL